MASTCIGPPTPAKFSVRSRYLLNVGDLPNSGTRKWICQDVKQAVFLLYPVLVLKFRILFSVWADSLMKRQSKDSEKQTRHFSDWFPFPVHSKLCSHMLPGEHSSLPRSTAVSLFSQQDIAFPVVTLVLAWIINCLTLLPGFHVCRNHCTWVPVLTLQLAGCVVLEGDNLSETQFPHLLDEDSFATYLIRLSRSHNA